MIKNPLKKGLIASVFIWDPFKTKLRRLYKIYELWV